MNQTEDKKPVPPRPATMTAPVIKGQPAPPDAKFETAMTTAKPAKFEVYEYTPVALARFSRPIQYPGRQSDPQVKTEKLNNGQTWEVEYLHEMRHIRITFSDPGRTKLVKVGYVPIEQVLSWEPLT